MFGKILLRVLLGASLASTALFGQCAGTGTLVGT
jgi:hypothetical protein